MSNNKMIKTAGQYIHLIIIFIFMATIIIIILTTDDNEFRDELLYPLIYFFIFILVCSFI